LQNPKVIPTPIDNKRQFLIKKGLTLDEVEAALKTAGAYNIPQDSMHQSLVPTQPQIIYQQVPPVVSSIWFRLAKWVASFIAAGCVAYTAYKLIVKKYFFSKKSKIEKQLESMTSTNAKLNDTLKEMRNSVEALKLSVEQIGKEINGLSKDKSIGSESEIKSEIQSVKSLLLNRSQFPSIPTVTPIIPSWQLNPKKENVVSNGTNSESDGDVNEKRE
jgi:peroxin-14